MSFVGFALALEMIVIVGIIFCVPYTEIDWAAYMDEVKGFLRGQLDYTKLQGGTGPLVYPGGFVWIFSALFYITKGGVDLQLAQWIFAGVYWSVFALALSFYYRSGHRRPSRAILPLLVSKRIRSLFVLRLFNDCWAVLLAYWAISFFADRRRSCRWLGGCLLFSLAVSVKMNIFLYAPGLLCVLLRSLALYKVVFFLSVCACWQLIAGYPFLSYNPARYVGRAFELSRVFTQRWSVNFQFLPNDIFVDPVFGKVLLAATVVSWLLAWRLRWRHRVYYLPVAARPGRRGSLHGSPNKKKRSKNGECTPAESLALYEEKEAEKDQIVYHAVVLTLMESNLIGVAFARSLHYQFYSWFFFLVPYVLYYTRLPSITPLLVFALVRQGFETYPPTEQSSMMVMVGLAISVLAVLFLGSDEGRDARTERLKAEEEGEAKQALEGTPELIAKKDQ